MKSYSTHTHKLYVNSCGLIISLALILNLLISLLHTHTHQIYIFVFQNLFDLVALIGFSLIQPYKRSTRSVQLKIVCITFFFSQLMFLEPNDTCFHSGFQQLFGFSCSVSTHCSRSQHIKNFPFFLFHFKNK